MKRHLIAAALALPGLAPVAAHAQAPAAAPAALILVVDTNRIVADSAAGKSATAQLKPQADQFQNLQRSRQDQFQKEVDALRQQAQAKTLAPEVLQQRQRDIQQRAQTAETELEGRGRSLQQSQNNVLQQINNAVTPIVSQIMRERNAQIVLSRSATLQTVASVDITGEVITRLDRALPRVNISAAPAPAAAAPKK